MGRKAVKENYDIGKFVFGECDSFSLTDELGGMVKISMMSPTDPESDMAIFCEDFPPAETYRLIELITDFAKNQTKVRLFHKAGIDEKV